MYTRLVRIVQKFSLNQQRFDIKQFRRPRNLRISTIQIHEFLNPQQNFLLSIVKGAKIISDNIEAHLKYLVSLVIKGLSDPS